MVLVRRRLGSRMMASTATKTISQPNAGQPRIGG
jgi:hypothetical protein